MICSDHHSPNDMMKLFEISLDLLVTAGMDGYFKVLNPAWENMLGWSLNELMEKPYLDFVHPDDIEKTRQEIHRLRRGERSSTSFHNRYRCRNGSYRWLLWSTVVKGDVFHASARDITELKEQAQLLRETNEMGQIGGWNFDLLTKKVSLSDQTYRMLDLPEGTILDHETALSFVLEPGRRRLFKASLEAVNTGQGFELELEYVSARGRRGWLRVKGRAERQEETMRRLFGLLQDITERKATELRLQDEQARMLQNSKMAALGEMAGSIAHEINTPLGVIILRADQIERLLSQAPARTNEAVAIAHIIGDTAEKIASIIRGLRAFARSGEQDPFEIKSLHAIIEETAALCAATFAQAGIRFSVDPVPPGLMIECRSVQVVQVLLNLLSNSKSAVENSCDGKQGWVHIACKEQGDRIAIHVIDSGPGVPSHIRSRIMEPFFTTKKVGEGTGLGLSISKGIVDDHEGHLYFEVDAPHTSFVVELPKCQSTVRRRPSAARLMGESSYSST